MAKNCSGLIEATNRRTESARNRVLAAIDSMKLHGETINVSSVAKKAGVSKNYIYTQDDLISAVKELREESYSTLSKRSQSSIINTLQKEVVRLEKRLKILEQVDLENDTWHSRYVAEREKTSKLEAQNKELRAEIKELRIQLQAAYTFSDVC